jgi:hypothetical protein
MNKGSRSYAVHGCHCRRKAELHAVRWCVEYLYTFGNMTLSFHFLYTTGLRTMLRLGARDDLPSLFTGWAAAGKEQDQHRAARILAVRARSARVCDSLTGVGDRVQEPDRTLQGCGGFRTEFIRRLCRGRGGVQETDYVGRCCWGRQAITTGCVS